MALPIFVDKVKTRICQFTVNRQPAKLCGMKHCGCIALSGFLWLAIGFSLLYKGLHLISDAAFQADTLCFRWQEVFGTPQQAATVFMGLGLLLGFIKGRFVLSKTVQRVSKRIASLSEPVRLADAYSRSYWILIASMMALGMLFRFLPIPPDLRGIIDVAVGSALLNGSLLFFRAARALKTKNLF